MRYLLLLLPLFLSSNECKEHLSYGKPSKTDKVLCRDAFAVGYNYRTKNADWVSAKITAKSVKGYNKRQNRFYEDKEIPKKYRAILKDYKNSGYDRGHLMPNATADYTPKAQKESFYLTNIAPQVPKLNRQGWKALEEDVRDWAEKYKELVVITGCIYDKKRDFIGNKVEIPDSFFKVIYAPKNKKMTAYIMPNSEVSSKRVHTYLTTVDEVEKATGMDFFSELPNNLEKRLESRKGQL
jgi:endonuclease G